MKMKTTFVTGLFVLIAFTVSAQFITLSPFAISFRGQKTWYCADSADKDLDGWADTAWVYTVKNSRQPSGCTKDPLAVPIVYDKNGYDATIFPGATELCDNKDNDQDDQIDEGLQHVTYFYDNDNDGFGDSQNSVVTCEQPLGTVMNSSDCNDNDVSVHVPMSYFIDADFDGFGSASVYLCNATAPLGYSTTNDDCNDALQAVNPIARESMNNIDDDCDGLVDEGLTNKLLNGYCDELTQWKRDHTEISMRSEPFQTNYRKLNSGFGTFVNGIATVHLFPVGLAPSRGMNFDVCRPYPGNTQTCGNIGGNTYVGDCSADGVGCYPHNIDFYGEVCDVYAENNISMVVNVNCYLQDWNEQRKFIDLPLSRGVNVIGVIFSTEIATPSWYANSYYFPRGAADYVIAWSKFRDSVKRYYNIPVGIWTGDIWDKKGYHYDWNTGIAATAKTADFIAGYGENSNITNRGGTNQALTEQQAIDTVLSFSWWFPKWIVKMKEMYNAKKIVLLTNGTNTGEQTIGTTFIGVLQTEYHIMCEQMDISNTMMAAQYYRTRIFNLWNPASSSGVEQNILFERGVTYSQPTTKEWLITNDREIVGVVYTKDDGHGWMEVINFSNRDYSVSGSVKGWTAPLLSDTRSAVYYTGNTVKAKSIGFVSF